MRAEVILIVFLEAINRSTVINKELIAMENELTPLYEKNELDALNLYIYGIILVERGFKDRAKEVLIKSVCKFPLIWSAWLQLSTLITKTDKLLFQKLPDCWALYFFYAAFYLEIHQETDCISIITELIKSFPQSVFLFNFIAQASYNNQGLLKINNRV